MLMLPSPDGSDGRRAALPTLGGGSSSRREEGPWAVQNGKRRKAKSESEKRKAKSEKSTDLCIMACFSMSAADASWAAALLLLLC
jgi:hypothetical protein